jgi:Na+-transporting NADH:ubiquinone oxidoreductase subunit C
VTNRESAGRTIAVAAGVALFCSLVVSLTVSWLRPIQLALRAVEQNRAVLVAAGLADPAETLADREVVRRSLDVETRLVDLDAAEFTATDPSMVAAYDFRAAADDAEARRAIAPELDIASLGTRPLVMPVYLLERDRSLERIVLPVYGRGMWSTIYGYIALDSDLVTIADVLFFEHGETPGIGDRIQNPDWTDSWIGARAWDDDGTLTLRIGGAADAPSGSRIDGITGATVTVSGVDRLVRYWLGADGYGPLLARLRSGS